MKVQNYYFSTKNIAIPGLKFEKIKNQFKDF